MKQTADPKMQKCKCKRIFSLYFGPLQRKFKVSALSTNFGDGLEFYIFSGE